MDTMLKGLFGGGDDSGQKQQQAQDFANRVQQGPIDQGYTEQEAAQHFQNVAQNADSATIQQAAEQTINRMSPDQRQQFGQMLQQRVGGQQSGDISNDPRQMASMVSQIHQQDPGGLASMFGGGGGGGGIMGALGGLLGGGGGSSGGGGIMGGGNSGGGFPGGTLGKVAMGGIAAYAMNSILGGGLGGLLGGGGNDSGGRSV